MGGVIILIATIVPCLLFGRLRNIYMILMLVTTVLLGAIGFADDYIKMKVTKDGLRPIYKLLGQAALGLIVGLTLWASPDAVIRENVSQQRHGTESIVYKSEPVKSTVTTIPFVKNNNLDYSSMFTWLGRYKSAATWIFFVLLTTFVVMAVSN
jgi:phospho-N-acetylmuramoyl-pentapeptide-transferase